MSDAKTVAVLQRELQAAEVERLRLVGELDTMRDGLKAAVELLDCCMGVPSRPDLDDLIRAAVARAEQT